MNNLDPENGLIDDIQLIQNKLARWLNGVSVKDKKRSRDRLKNINMLSVNQINAQVKLTEMWKAHNVENYPLKLEKKLYDPELMVTRAASAGALIEKGFTSISSKTFKNDAIRVWNKCPQIIKDSATIYTAKKMIKEFVLTLPV